MIKKIEPVTKLQYPEKSMILRLFARAALAARVLVTNRTPRGLVRNQERKRPQKGDFAGYWSFLTGSIIISLLFALTACQKEAPAKPQKPLVLVSIAPYAFLAKQIGLDRIEVQSIVPEGMNPHTFEPTLAQAAKISRASVWFRIGEPFEEKITPFLQEKNRELKIFDLRDGIDLIGEEGHCCSHCSKDHLDRHIWLNPKLAAIQAKQMAEALILSSPENSSFFSENLIALEKSLSELDLQIAFLLKPLEKRTLLVSHPAFGYFCKEYALKQLSVEYEGKEPRPRQLERVVKEAETSGLKMALTLPQYNNKGTELIAKKFQLVPKMIDPYSSDYIATMHQLAEMIAE